MSIDDHFDDFEGKQRKRQSLKTYIGAGVGLLAGIGFGIYLGEKINEEFMQEAHFMMEYTIDTVSSVLFGGVMSGVGEAISQFQYSYFDKN